jgi:trimethylamine:corrinoid methyltransferase-like protein
MTTPHTRKTAIAAEYSQVVNAYAIRVSNAKYRSADINGVVELANGMNSFHALGQKLCAKAKLAWFDMEFKKGFRSIDLSNAQVQILPNYTGEVISKFA